MHYMGGKHRAAKRLAACIDLVRRPGQWVWDPFCGGLSMSAALSVNGPVLASDAHAALIYMYRAVQAGWDPPSRVSEEEYYAAKRLPPEDPLHAFCGYGCAFAGKWRGGYARSPQDTARNFASSARNAVIRDVPRIAAFACLDFLMIAPRPTNAVLYLDPPYHATTGYLETGKFDHTAFYERALGWAEHTHVFLSEYASPIGTLVCVVKPTSERTLRESPVERLYYLGR